MSTNVEDVDVIDGNFVVKVELADEQSCSLIDATAARHLGTGEIEYCGLRSIEPAYKCEVIDTSLAVNQDQENEEMALINAAIAEESDVKEFYALKNAFYRCEDIDEPGVIIRTTAIGTFHHSSTSNQVSYAGQGGCSYIHSYTFANPGFTRHMNVHDGNESFIRLAQQVAAWIKAISSNYATKDTRGENINAAGRRNSTGKKHMCPHCTHSTAKRTNLVAHIARKHGTEADKRFECGQCTYRSVEKGHLITHIARKHGSAEDRIYKCSQCAYSCVENCQLLRHFRQVHGTDDDKKHKCPHCSYCSVQSCNVRLHIKRRH